MSDGNPTEPAVEATPQATRSATIHIFLNSSGELDVDVKKVKVEAEGTLTFKLKSGDQKLETFAVLMLKRTPFKNKDVTAGGGKGKPVTCPIDDSAHDPDGTGASEFSYPYCVIASNGTKSYHMDPEIVVGPKPT